MKGWTILRWLLIILTSCLLVYFGLYLWLQRDGAAPVSAGPVIEAGNMAPLFSLRTTRGDELGPLQFRGKPVVLNFCATWSGPCREEMAVFQEIYDHYAAQGLVLLAVHHKGSSSEVAKFGQELNLTFPLLLDLDGAVTERYGVTSFPTTVFIDASGKVRRVNIGAMDLDKVDTGIQLIFTPIMPTPTWTPTLQASPTSTETTAPPQFIDGCVTVSVLNARQGPGKSFPVEKGIVKDTCLRFDARSQDLKWLRIADQRAANGARLWLSTDYVKLNAGIDLLPVGE